MIRNNYHRVLVVMEAELESVRQYVITHIDMIDESFGMLQKLISMQNVEIHVI